MPRKSVNARDHRFTLLPITAANGVAVIYVVIFRSKEEKTQEIWKTGIDVRVSPKTILRTDCEGKEVEVVDECDLENYGPGKYFPGGPCCQHNGKKIPCASFVSESGGITADILVKVLKIMDDLNLFPRVNGSMPFLLVDGHQSRLDPVFLEYINNAGHRWKVCLGVPYATTLWQVGDSSQQNGSFKSPNRCHADTQSYRA